MDKLAYNYNKVNGKLVNNQLQYVTDMANANNYTDDIKTQPVNNYRYDAIGNLTSDVQGKIINIEWNVANKITFIEREKFSGMDNLRFYYDGMGNRIQKQTSPVDGTTLETNNTWYVRDAQGNIMATYTWKNAENPQLAEQYIYGSSRLGYVNRAGLTTPANPTHAIGLRQYELTNHLGNVLTTVSDRPVAFSDGVNIPVDGYTADIVSTQDYYPGGSLMPGRNYNPDTYRFGFNGQEKDDEIAGTGNSYTAMFWQYDPRILRRWNRDPKPNPAISVYATFSNNPIWFSDPLGDTIIVGKNGDVSRADRDKDDNLVDNLVFTQGENGILNSIGELGAEIDVSEIFPNIMQENKEEAKELGILGWAWNVKPEGKWDYKANKNTIFGLAWSETLKKQKINPDAKHTSFRTEGFTFQDASDVGNYNAGFTGSWTYNGGGIYPVLQVVGAGFVETLKDFSNGDFHDAFNQTNQLFGMPPLPPFGDEVDDFFWNTFGMSSSLKEQGKLK